MARQYLPTDFFVYKNIRTESDEKIVYLSGLGLPIQKQREGFVRRFALNYGISYLALDYTSYVLRNWAQSDFGLSQAFPRTMDILAQDSKKLFLCGSCFGGLMAMKAAAQLPNRVSSVIALAPSYETKEFPWVEKAAQYLEKREKLRSRKKIDTNLIKQMIFFHQVILTAFRNQGREKIETTFQRPVHIFHGQNDRLIPAENSIHIQRSMHNPNFFVHITPQTGHTFNTDFEMKMPIQALRDCLNRD